MITAGNVAIEQLRMILDVSFLGGKEEEIADVIIEANFRNSRNNRQFVTSGGRHRCHKTRNSRELMEKIDALQIE